MRKTVHYSYAVNILKYLPQDAGRPVWFSISGPTVVVITDANKCFFYDGHVIRERILWPIEHAHLTEADRCATLLNTEEGE